MTRFVAIPLLGVGLTLGAFGVIRGATNPGPGEGVRVVLAIAPPVDDDARAMAVHIAKARLEEKGAETRVVPAGDQLVVELGETDPGIIDDSRALLTRTANVELHVVMPNDSWPAADYVATDDRARQLGIHVADGALLAEDRESDLPIAEADAIACRGREEDGKRHCIVRGDQILATYLAAIPALAVPHGRILAYGRAEAIRAGAWRTYLLDDVVLAAGPEIRRVEVGDGGVIVDLTDEAARRVVATARARPGAPIATVLDGKVKALAPLPADTSVPTLHLRTTAVAGKLDETAIRDALDLQAVLEAGAAHKLNVIASTPFTRTTGFLPRAWPFLALALLSLVAAWFVWRRRA
jgi:preprotein translocase subunit SecD